MMVLGLCPAIALAGEVEVEPEGTAEPVAVVQGEGVSTEEPTVSVQEGPVKYLDANGREQPCTDYTTIYTGSSYDGSSYASLNNGWYFVTGKVTITQVAFPDYVNLILADGAELTVNEGIAGPNGTLTVYGQSMGENMGKLSVSGYIAVYCAGITINGGTVTASGKSEGINAAGSGVTINGGTVTATATGEVGIGINADKGVTINGGTMTATGMRCAVYASGTVTIGKDMSVMAGASEATAEDHTTGFATTFTKYQWAQTTSVVPVQSVTVDPTTATLTVGETADLKATVTPDNATDKAVTWKSSNEAVAKVDADGKVTAVAPGEATITATAGGKSRRMEALTLRLPDGVSGGIEYRGHVQRSGWEKDWKADGAQSGTTGKSRRVEAVQIQLTGEAKDAYDVYYRVHVQRYGWMGWAKNGEEAGTTGMSRHAEAIQVVLVKKDAPAPDATYKGVTQQYAKAFVKK